MKQETSPEQSLDEIIGAAVRKDRVLAGLTVTQLAERAQVSAAMISKIERGQVSASLNTLNAVARAIGVPLVNLLADTAQSGDVSFVAAGEGMTVQRTGSAVDHEYKMIGRAASTHTRMESFEVTLEGPLRTQMVYQHRGVEFIHVVSGGMIYRCGDVTYSMQAGDSLSFQSDLPHGPVELTTDKVTFLTVASRVEGASS